MGRKTLALSTLTFVAVLTFFVAGPLLPSETRSGGGGVDARAVSIAVDLLREIESKEFDEATTGGRKAYRASDLTPSQNVGAEPGSFVGSGPLGELNILWPDSATPLGPAGFAPFEEHETSGAFHSKSLYDDIDDFHGYRRKVRDARHGSFYAWVTVHYVHEEQPDVIATIPTFQKSVTVTVTHPDLAVDDSPSPGKIVLKDIVAYRRFSPLPLLKGSLPYTSVIRRK
ncbi:MAG: hypothetical protein HY562_00620 [Ignavibacteriales bacterium]|nr:hypothetical protein [Ignavibacteriales bacterium]